MGPNLQQVEVQEDGEVADFSVGEGMSELERNRGMYHSLLGVAPGEGTCDVVLALVEALVEARVAMVVIYDMRDVPQRLPKPQRKKYPRFYNILRIDSQSKHTFDRNHLLLISLLRSFSRSPFALVTPSHKNVCYHEVYRPSPSTTADISSTSSSDLPKSSTSPQECAVKTVTMAVVPSLI